MALNIYWTTFVRFSAAIFPWLKKFWGQNQKFSDWAEISLVSCKMTWEEIYLAGELSKTLVFVDLYRWNCLKNVKDLLNKNQCFMISYVNVFWSQWIYLSQIESFLLLIFILIEIDTVCGSQIINYTQVCAWQYKFKVGKNWFARWG